MTLTNPIKLLDTRGNVICMRSACSRRPGPLVLICDEEVCCSVGRKRVGQHSGAERIMKERGGVQAHRVPVEVRIAYESANPYTL